jgi:hypothetical protein
MQTSPRHEGQPLGREYSKAKRAFLLSSRPAAFRARAFCVGVMRCGSRHHFLKILHGFFHSAAGDILSDSAGKKPER